MCGQPAAVTVQRGADVHVAGRDRKSPCEGRGASAARKDPGGQGTLRTRRNLLAKLQVDSRCPVPSAARSRCRAPGLGAGLSVAAGGHGLGPMPGGHGLSPCLVGPRPGRAGGRGLGPCSWKCFFNPVDRRRPILPTGVSCSVTRVYISVSCQ